MAAATAMLLRLWHVGRRIAHEVHATALPCRADVPLDGGLQPFVRVRDNKLDAVQAASGQALRKSAQKVSASDGPKPSRRSRAVLRCWRPQRLSRRPRRCVRPRALSGRSHPATDRASRLRAALREGLHALVDFSPLVADMPLRDAGKPHRLRDPRRPGASTPRRSGLLDDGDGRPFRRLARLRNGGVMWPPSGS